MTAATLRPLTMLTFAPMVDSACTRLVLNHYGVAFAERDHVFGLVSLMTVLHGGYGRIPLVYGPGMRFSGPRPIVDRLDAGYPDRRLLPPEQPARQGIEADWTLYNWDLAVNVAGFAYYHLLQHKPEMIKAFAAPLPKGEARLMPLFFPIVRVLMKLLLRLGAARAADSRLRIAIILDDADRRLADGRTFLWGERRTLADLALASAITPLLVPPSYGPYLPPEAEWPNAYRALVAETRTRPVAAYAERILAALS